MRVIAGQYRSRRLSAPRGEDTRPTSDRLRETLFNVLGPRIEDAVFLDLYAGSGAVGIEALSRGARHAVFIEKDRAAVQLIRSNLASLGIEARARVIHGNASLLLGTIEADIAFIDPPYPKEREYRAAMEALESKPPRLAIVQHSTHFQLAETCGPLHRTRIAKYGDNALSFYRVVL